MGAFHKIGASARGAIRGARAGLAGHVVATPGRKSADSAIDRDELTSALAASRIAQTNDVWNRYKIYRADGNTVEILKALQEMYLRVTRTEEKVNRLLGQPQITAARAAKPRLRLCTVPLPEPPVGVTCRTDRAALEMTVHWSMYVPKVLAQKGFGGYERPALAHFLAALEGAPDGCFLDVGANIGPYALLARAYSDREVIAFEPTPDLADIARSAGETNGIPYVVEEIALGDQDGTATLYISDRTDSSNSLNPEFRPNTWTLAVPLERLDAYVRRVDIRPGLLKIDTESTEPAVLRGAQETLEKFRPWIFCEVLEGYAESELEKALAAFGYSWYHVSDIGPLEPRTAITGDSINHFMWLFTPEPLTDAHWQRAAKWHETLEATGTPGALELLPEI